MIFNQIPSTLRNPGVVVEIDSTGALPSAATRPQRSILIGQARSVGTQPVLTPARVTSAKQGENLFGAGSQLAGMIAAFLAVNASGELWACSVADPSGGIAATGTATVTVSGPQAGTLAVYVGGRRYAVTCSTVSTGSSIASDLVNAVNADTGAFVSASAVSNVVTFTAKQVGVIGNGIDLRTNYADGDSTPSGVTCSLSAMASGAGDVDLSAVWPKLQGTTFDVIGVGVHDVTNVGRLEAELAERWSPMRDDAAVGVAAVPLAQGAAQSFGNGRNSPYVVHPSTYKFPEPAHLYGAAVAGVIAREAEKDPGRPYFTLELTGRLPAQVADRQTQAERGLLLGDGISTLLVGPGGVVQVERLITSYQVNAAGAADGAFFDVTTTTTLAALLWSVKARLRTKFSRSKIANDGTQSDIGTNVVTPSVVKAETVAWYAEMEAAGLVEDREAFASTLVVERAAADPTRVEMRMSPNLTNPLAVIAAQFRFVL